ncbi:MAG: hypothetical protein KJO46_06100 [Gammaproteobacteria bacterium]|nr:hypothetical protein [Gammaproteobacteria bacterium]
MNLAALSSAATVALATTVAYLLIARSWTAISRTLGSRPYFADSILRESGQRYRDDLQRLTASQSIYLGGVLVFGMLFTAAYMLRAQPLFAGYPGWQVYLQLGFLGLAALFAVYKLATTIIARRQLRFLHDASVAIGHQLSQMSSGVTHIYHDVETSAGVIDHVVVCQLGVFGVNVIAKRCARGAAVCCKDNRLHFSNQEEPESVVDLLARNRRLGKRLQGVSGHPVNVRSVIALPGWEIAEQADDAHLLVNERNAGMLLGWKDTTSFLMDDDVSAIREALTQSCHRVASGPAL